jgi:hypothetical protein
VKPVAYAIAFAASFCCASLARAELFDFSTLRAAPGGSLAAASYTTPGGEVTVEAFFFQGAPTNAYVQGPVIVGTALRSVSLFVRNEGSALGLGVCTPYESTSAACSATAFAGGGDGVNELDNAGGVAELIRISRGEHYRWDAIWLSSLAGGERGNLRYSNDGSLAGLLPGGSFTTYLQTDPVSAAQQVALRGEAAMARYLYLLPGPTGTDNDHLLWKVQVTHMPEPSAVALLALGLVPLAAAVRRTRARGDRPQN